MNRLHEEFFDNGILKEKGNLLDGKRNGLWEFYNEDGHLTEKVKYVNEFEFWEIFFDSGEKRKFLIKNNLVEGVLENFYKTNRIEEKRYFKNDLEYFKESYFENGQLSRRGPILEKKKDGVWEYYFENGQLYSIGVYLLDKKEGLWENYYDNGQLESKNFYKYGELDGFRETYYENGQLKSNGHYSDGNQDGVWEKFDEEGHLKEKGNYSNNEKDGFWEIHYENWILKGRYQDGFRSGIWESYQDGKLGGIDNYDEYPLNSLHIK